MLYQNINKFNKNKFLLINKIKLKKFYKNIQQKKIKYFFNSQKFMRGF